MLWWLAQNTMTAALLAGVVWLACRVRSFSPAAKHAMWLVVLLKLVTPPLVTWPWPVPSFFEWNQAARERPSRDVVERDSEADTTLASIDFMATESDEFRPPEWNHGAVALEGPCTSDSELFPAAVARISTEPAPFGANTPATPASAETDDHRSGGVASKFGLAAGRARTLLASCWILGVAVSVLVHLIQIVRFLRLIDRAEETPQSLEQRARHISAMLHVRAPRVLVVDGIRSPVIWGGARAQLVWPACLTMEARSASEQLPAIALRPVSDDSAPDSPRSRLRSDFESGHWDGVIAHELAHLRRRDHWVGWLELIAGCVYWWNPVFWYVRHQLRENAELACDALVVWALPDGRRRYAESLIEVVSHFSPVAAPVPVLGVNSVARQAFERRLTMILCERVPWKLSVRALLVIGLLALVALPGWSLGQVAATTPRPDADPNVAAPDPVQETAGTLEQVPVQYRAVINPNPTPGAPSTVEFTKAPMPAQALGDDSRIDALEKKLDAIIAEVRALRAGRNAPAKTPTTSGVSTLLGDATATKLSAPAHAVYGLTPTGSNWAARTQKGSADSDVQMLSRGSYAMPKPKADALAAFLREHMKATVEVSVKDDDGKTSLVVTASPEVQAVIGQFIALSEGRQPPAPFGYRDEVAAMSQHDVVVGDYPFLQVQPNVNYYKLSPTKATPSPSKTTPVEPAVPNAVPPASKR
jgi:beta-lactamase regulating signal transducer with metallopeptidase domain